MPRIEYRADGVYLLDRKVKNGAKLERLDGSEWVLKPINVWQDQKGRWASSFGYAPWIENLEAAGKDGIAIPGHECELRWPQGEG
jgi:hypothetical protein